MPDLTAQPQQDEQTVSMVLDNIEPVKVDLDKQVEYYKCTTDGCILSFSTYRDFEQHLLTSHMKQEEEKPQIVRDEKGRIVKPIPQDTNKNGTAGRPCECCKNMEVVLQVTQDYLSEARNARKSNKPFIPYQQDLADRLDIDADTVWAWATKKTNTGDLEHPEFAGLVKSLNNIKELLLLQRTTGRYNPTGAIFQLKTKHGYIETEKRILNGGEDNEPLEIRIVEAKKDAE